MLFNTFEFLWLFPIIFIVYYLIISRNEIVAKWPRIGNYLLIAISYGIYIKWKPIYALVLLAVTTITFISALVIEKNEAYGKKKYIIFSGLLLALLPLLIFKYYNFISTSLAEGLSNIGIQVGLPGLNWAMPLGISFFTLQAIGYLADVYLQRIKAEHNWWDYMLFICFFPQIASGPISKARDLLPQIKGDRKFEYSQFVDGLQWLLWGMFLKVTVADRLGTIVDSVYSNWIYNDGTSCLIASIMYTFQIYSDFAGYSFMAMGVGKLLGFDLINNFNRPYLSMSVTEFWHRWHISLSTWLKDYIYIPLGGNRCSKLKNYWNIFVTFLVSGIWHGANWTFIVWGMLHGLFQVIEKALHLQKSQSTGFIKGIRIFVTFILVDFAWIFFRMPTLSDACGVLGKIFTNPTTNISTFMGNKSLLFPLYLLIIKDIVDEFFPKYNLYHSKYLLVRWSTYVMLTVIILLFGVFDAGQFIYVSF
jgi:alginate O-acetyltransferase complex protein AlgI